MKRKVIEMIIVMSMAISLVACGGTANTAQEAPAPTTEAPKAEEPKVEEPVEVEETEIEEVVEEPTETTEEPEEFALTVEYATDKLQKMADAYNALFDSKGEVEELATRFLYDGSVEIWTEDDVQTKDGYSIQNVAVDYDRDLYSTNGIGFGTLLDYYYNYVNKDTGYISFKDYIGAHNKDELADIFLKKVEDSEKNGGTDTNDYYMNNVIWIPAIISHDGNTVTIENATGDVTIEHKDIVISDLSTATVAYQADIYIDGKDSGLKLVFDKDGNLLNLNDENATIEVVIPFK